MLVPGMDFTPGRQMLHEEDIIFAQEGALFLSRRVPQEFPVIR